MSENRVEIEPYEYSEEFNNINPETVKKGDYMQGNQHHWWKVNGWGYDNYVITAYGKTEFVLHCIDAKPIVSNFSTDFPISSFLFRCFLRSCLCFSQFITFCFS